LYSHRNSLTEHRAIIILSY